MLITNHQGIFRQISGAELARYAAFGYEPVPEKKQKAISKPPAKPVPEGAEAGEEEQRP